MKDEIARPMIDVLNQCAGKLTKLQLEMEGRLSVPWIEAIGTNEVVAEGVVFEAFADGFERASQMPYQRELAQNFKTFVEDLGSDLFGRGREGPNYVIER